MRKSWGNMSIYRWVKYVLVFLLLFQVFFLFFLVPSNTTQKIKKAVLDTSDTIFISLAAYRDPELGPTIRDALKKAKHPRNLRFGICIQDDWKVIKKFPFKEEKGGLFRVVQVNASDSQGACWARAQAQSKYKGEKYILQGDSHLRFVKNWDEKLISWIRHLQKYSEKPIISTYPIPYYPGKEDYLNNPNPTKMTLDKFDGNGVIVFKTDYIPNWKKLHEPVRTHFLAGGFSFTLGRWIEDVPYDPQLYFIGEEISMAVRSFTHGYDIYYPHRAIVYHAYSNGKDRTKHWEEHKDWYVYNKEATKRVKQLLGTEKPATIDFEKYGLGTVRSLNQFEEETGIDFEKQVIIRDPMKGDAQYAVALGDYKPKSDVEMELKKGNIYEMGAQTELGWCYATTMDKMRKAGWVPCNQMKFLDKDSLKKFLQDQKLDDDRSRGQGITTEKSLFSDYLFIHESTTNWM